MSVRDEVNALESALRAWRCAVDDRYVLPPGGYSSMCYRHDTITYALYDSLCTQQNLLVED